MFCRIFCLVSLIGFWLGSSAWAQTLSSSNELTPSHLAPAESMQKAAEWNQKLQHSTLRELSGERMFVPVRPVPDDAEFRYVVLSGTANYHDEEFQRNLSQNLPPTVDLIILSESGDEARISQLFSRWLPQNRFMVFTTPSEISNRTFWARDWFPFPVYKNTSGDVGLVSWNYDQHARDYGQYTPERQKAANAFKKRFAENNGVSINFQEHYFVGGNLLADHDGVCFAVNSSRFYAANPEDLKAAMGCSRVVLFPHVSGIGDVDEVLKLLPNRIAVTPIREYKSTLEAQGYSVVLLPGLTSNKSNGGAKNLGTYANTLILGRKIFMPSYNQASDVEAKRVYESLGYEVIMSDSTFLSFQTMGSLHCATMGLPNMNIQVLAKMLGARIYQKPEQGFVNPWTWLLQNLI